MSLNDVHTCGCVCVWAVCIAVCLGAEGSETAVYAVPMQDRVSEKGMKNRSAAAAAQPLS